MDIENPHNTITCPLYCESIYIQQERLTSQNLLKIHQDKLANTCIAKYFIVEWYKMNYTYMQ